MTEDQYCSIHTHESWNQEIADWEAQKEAARLEREAKIREMQWLIMQIEIEERYIAWLDWVIALLKVKRDQYLEECRENK